MFNHVVTPIFLLCLYMYLHHWHGEGSFNFSTFMFNHVVTGIFLLCLYIDITGIMRTAFSYTSIAAPAVHPPPPTPFYILPHPLHTLTRPGDSTINQVVGHTTRLCLYIMPHCRPGSAALSSAPLYLTLQSLQCTLLLCLYIVVTGMASGALS